MRESYTAASAYPIKVAADTDLVQIVKGGHIPPVHVQFIPTNRCNLACSFCSCAKRDKGLVMGVAEVEEMVAHLYSEGCEAVTITGGGEPLLHPDIAGVLSAFDNYGIQIGLVTNGTQFSRLSEADLARVTWCRISACDERPFDAEAVTEGWKKGPGVDWAFSYVLSDKPDIANLSEHFAFAESHDFTHVRVVADLMDPESVAMAEAKAKVASPLAIWQPRTEYVPGMPDCRISLLKPVIGPDGQVYPCCGVQYAETKMALDLPDGMSMGRWPDIGRLIPFDGTRCVRCYYPGYNELLRGLQSEIAHKSFV